MVTGSNALATARRDGSRSNWGDRRAIVLESRCIAGAAMARCQHRVVTNSLSRHFEALG